MPTHSTARGKPSLPAIEGWFTMDPEDPRLIGTRCRACGSYFFPKETRFCRNPDCPSTELEEVMLSRKGRIWSLTDNRYMPPAPFISRDPFEPYAIAAVELADEKMVVLGQLLPGTDVLQLSAGDEVEMVLDELYQDEEHSYLVWKWKAVKA